jgi:phosphatidylglycerophosphatase A
MNTADGQPAQHQPGFAAGIDAVEPAASAPPPAPPRRASAAFMLRHPARWLALGLGSGLSRVAPGTVGTLWAWVAFLVLDPWLSDGAWAVVLALACLVGVWACARTAQELGTADPGQIVWDEIVAFWIVLWLVTPAGFWVQAAAFGLFRWFDIAKPGPVGWADRLLDGRTSPWARGLGILLDDLVAAACTLLVMALGVAAWQAIA